MRVRSLAGEIRALASAEPSRSAVHFVSKTLGDRTVCRGELLEQSEKVAGLIREAAPARSGVIVIVMDHSMDLLYSLVGAILCGRTPSIFSLPSAKLNIPKYFEALPKLLENADADLLITDRRLYDLFGGWGIRFEKTAVLADGQKFPPAADVGSESETPTLGAPEVLIRDADPTSPPVGGAFPAVLQYSSGTTGLRKGVALGDEAILDQIDSYGAAIGLSDDDVIVSWLPLYHDMGLIACCLMPLVKGVPVVWISPFDWVTDPVLWFRSVHRFRGTLSWLPNFSYNYSALKVPPESMSGIDLKSLRGVINCSEPVRADSHRMFLEKFKSCGLRPEALGTCYALAENTFAVTEGGLTHPVVQEDVDADEFFRNNVAIQVSSGRSGYPMLSSGRPFSGQEVRIVDANRRDLPSRRVGEIAIRSRCLMNEYYKNPEATRASLDSDGWFYSGDLGYLTEEHDLFVTGRIKDMIIVSGVNVYPSDIEYLVSDVAGIHPGRVAAFGVYNEGKGTEDLVVIAEWEPSWNGREREIEARIRRQISMCAECPVSDIRLVPPMWLLKSSSGKIARASNKEKYLAEFKAGNK